MKKIIQIFVICLVVLFNGSSAVAQSESGKQQLFDDRMEEIQEMTENQLYSKAMRELKDFEKTGIPTSSVDREVEYRLMVSRVYRLFGELGEAMIELNKLPSLKNKKRLKSKVDLVKASLYLDDGQYSTEQKVKILYPLLEEGIKNAKATGQTADLAAYFNLKATMLKYESGWTQVNKAENVANAKALYKESMRLFLELKDTVNYHNVLNGLFSIELGNPSSEIEELSKILSELTEKSTYSPNIITSRNYLSHYYQHINKNPIKYLTELNLAKDAKIEEINKNADNTIKNILFEHELDSLKMNVDYNKDIVERQEVLLMQKNRSINQTILFISVLVILLVVLIYLLFRQKKLGREMDLANIELQSSNHNYELLVRESNHRIKNNLQMIASMLELDKENLSEESVNVLSNLTAKITTISALHRILNFKEHNQKILLTRYFEEITSYYIDLTKSEFTTDFAQVEIESERILYFGLILNEMISNTMKHRKLKDEIVIQVLKSRDAFIFIYRDNSNFNEFTKNNGIQLIEGLIARVGGFDSVFNSKLGEYKFYFHA